MFVSRSFLERDPLAFGQAETVGPWLPLGGWDCALEGVTGCQDHQVHSLSVACFSDLLLASKSDSLHDSQMFCFQNLNVKSWKLN